MAQLDKLREYIEEQDKAGRSAYVTIEARVIWELAHRIEALEALIQELDNRTTGSITIN